MSDKLEELRVSAQKVAVAMDKMYTLFDLEDLNPKEAVAALVSCVAAIIFTGGDIDKHEENLELSITALKHMYEVYKKEYLDET